MKLTEHYATIQGTGVMSGQRQYFARFAGCSVMKCPIRSICDQPESLGKSGGIDVSPEEIVDEALSIKCSWIHITGGEPCDQPEALAELSSLAKSNGLKVQIQTSGMSEVDCDWDVLTISPKSDDPVQRTATEVIVVFQPTTLDCFRLDAYQDQITAEHYWLQPPWTDEGCDYFHSAQMVNIMEGRGKHWKLASQMHKYAGLK